MSSSGRLPHPATVVGMIALTVALAGTAIAQDPVAKLTKAKVRSIANKEIVKAAPGLSVASATTAQNAENASNAQNAQNLGGSPPSAFAPANVEPYHEVGAPGEPAFAIGWSNEDPVGETTAAFFKDPWGIVHLKGIVLRSTGTTLIFTLPAEYRPTKSACVPSVRVDNLSPAYICILPNGAVNQSSPDIDGTYLLDGITFRAGAG